MNTQREIPLKRWIADESERLNLSRGAVWYRLRRSPKLRYPDVRLRIVNKRVVFVESAN